MKSAVITFVTFIGDEKVCSAVNLENSSASFWDLNTLNLDPFTFFAVFKAKFLSENTNWVTETDVKIILITHKGYF